MSARQVATEVLFRVAERGAWAAPSLDAGLRAAGLGGRDAALATELVYGTLRVLPEIDALLGELVRRGLSGLDGWTLAAMRVAAYQLLHLSRVPPHAAVDEAVTLVRSRRGARLAGLSNAVLRRAAGERPPAPAPPAQLVLPDWLAGDVREAVGPERAEAFLSLRPLPPPQGVRVRTARVARDEAARAIRAARPDAEVQESTMSPEALLLRRAGDVRELPGHAEGWLAAQEHGSQLVGLLAGPRPDERVADACAGRGTKTAQLLEAVGPGGHVTALDLHEAKLDRIIPELQRLRLPAGQVDTLAVDLTVGTAGLDGRFDRVLVDAPCTGTGTVHRRPELLLRLGPEDPERLARVQADVLAGAARLLRPGGTLIYAVCAVGDREGRGVVEAVLGRDPGLTRDAGPWPLPVPVEADGSVRLGPWLGDMDAYQIFRLTRVGEDV